MLYGLGGMAVCFTLLTSMFCFQVKDAFLGSQSYLLPAHMCSLKIQEGFYSNQDTAPTVTAPGVLLILSSLGITIFYALGPGKKSCGL